MELDHIIAQAQRPQMVIAAPLNDTQLIVLAAATLFGKQLIQDTDYAVDVARSLVVDAIVQEREESLQSAVEKRWNELHPSEDTPAGRQYIIPGATS